VSNPSKEALKKFTRNTTEPLKTDKEVYLYILELDQIVRAAKFVEEKLPHKALNENIDYAYWFYKNSKEEKTPGLVDVFHRSSLVALQNHNIAPQPILTIEGVLLEEVYTLFCIMYSLPIIYTSLMESDLLKEAKEYTRTQLFNNPKNYS